MDINLQTKMWRNIRLYGIYQVFTKRFFLPLTTIYASEVAGLSIAQIGLTTTFSMLVSIVFETTSGFWADKHGRKNSSRVGSLLTAVGTCIYIVAPSFIGILLASSIVAIGYSFLSGSMAALIHDSLVVLKKEKQFTKIASRAQSLSLVANAIIMALVPLLYPIDKRLPFVVGVIAYLILFAVSSLLTEPPIKHSAEKEERHFIKAVRHIVNRKTIGIFLVIGFMYGMIFAPVDQYNLGYKELGLPPHMFGLLFGTASLVAAAAGFVVHKLEKLSFTQYLSLEFGSIGFMMFSMGYLKNLPLTVVAFLINMTIFRYQRIMYQHYLVRIFGNTRYKATLLSVATNMGQIQQLWLIPLFTGVANITGILASFNYLFAFLLAVWPLVIWFASRSVKSASASAGELAH